MPYLNLDINYFDHIKTVRLVAILGRGAAELPLRLWAHCANHHPGTGILPGYSIQDIETLCGWWGEKSEMVTAMVKLNFIREVSKGWKVHGWSEHEGHLVAFKKRAKKAAQIRWSKMSKSSHATSNAKVVPKQCPILAVPTIPNQLITTGKNESSASPPQTAGASPVGPEKVLEWFTKIWEAYPAHRRHGREAALEAFTKRVKTLESAKRCANAMEAYVESVTDPQYVLRASRWFQDWEDQADDNRRSSQGIHNQSDVGQPNSGNAGEGTASETERMLHQLADLAQFPEQHKARDR